MIKNVLIPENIGHYYLFSKRIIGFDIGKTQIRATQLKLTGNTYSIERWFEQPIPSGPGNNYDERVTQTIHTILEMADHYDAIHTLLPSSLVILKELKMPFADYNKIKMIIDFEVEPLLPFSVSDAIIDFIITKKTEDNQSELLVAAVQKQYISHHLQLFTAAGVSPSIISIDFFALYELYRKTPVYANLPHGVALINIESYETSIAYIQNGQLKFVRTLPKGLVTVAKSISNTLKTEVNTAIETLIRFGVNKTENVAQNDAITEAFNPLLNEITFTLQSFTPQTNDVIRINQLYLLGSGAQINGLIDFIQNSVNIPCEQLQIHALIEGNKFSLSLKNNISNVYIMSLSAAASELTIPSFNLRQKELSPQTDTSLFYKQLAMASVLFLLLISTLTTFYFIETGRLSKAANQAEQEAMDALHQQFKNIPISTLDDMVEEAQDEIKKEEKLWAVFNPTRTSMLQYLLELTNRVDQDALKFTIDKLQISDHTMKITAHVKNYDALILLEKELRQSKLFSFVEEQNDPDFTMTIKLVPNT